MTNYQLAQAETFPFELGKVPKKVAKAYQRVVCPTLRTAPETSDVPLVKKLKGYKQLWRIRVADDYRLVYRVEQEQRTVVMLMIGHRSECYSRLGASETGEPGVRIIANAEELIERAPTPEERGRALIEVSASVPVPTTPDTPLPVQLTRGSLEAWGISPEHFPMLEQLQTEGELLGSCPPLPSSVIERVLEALWPRNIEEIVQKPVRLASSPEATLEAAEGLRSLESFLLRLDPEQEEIVARFGRGRSRGPWLLKGGPGSGKSTMVLYCIRALLEQAQEELALGERGLRILLTTYTTSLSRASQQLLEDLGCLDGRHQVQVANVDQLAAKLLPPAFHSLSPIPSSREFIVGAIQGRQGDATSFPFTVEDAEYLAEEFDWVILGHGCDSEAGYLAADRSGRTRRLGEPQRQAVWQLFLECREAMRKAGKCLWGERRLVALKQAKPVYDYVFIDEAQDLVRTAIRLCVALCNAPSQIFVAADSNQSIYGNGMSWASVASTLRFQGRARLLKHNYRSTQEIWEAAKQLAPAAASARDAETMDIEAVSEGPPPLLVSYTSLADVRTWLDGYLHSALLEERLTGGAAAILCPTNTDVTNMVNLVDARFNPKAMVAKEVDLRHPGVKIMTMHAAKGLQFPIVILGGIQKGRMPLTVPDGVNQVEHLDRQQRLLFVAASRAMHRLVVLANRDSPSPFLKLMDPSFWEAVDL